MDIKTTMWIVKINTKIIRKFLFKERAQKFIARALEEDKTCKCTLLSQDLWFKSPIG